MRGAEPATKLSQNPPAKYSPWAPQTAAHGVPKRKVTRFGRGHTMPIMTPEPEAPQDASAQPRLGWQVWLLVFLVFTGLYALTAQRTVSWQDSGEFQWRALNADLTGTMGLARAHPLYIAAGHVLARISRDHFPWLINAFSGLGMAVALANLAALGTWLSGKRWIGLLVAAALGLSHAIWWLSTAAEVYTWSVAGLTVELCLLISLIRRPRWQPLALLALVSGLGLCVHNFALLPLPVYVAVAVWLTWKRRLPAWSWAAAAAAWLIGAGFYIGMTVDLAIQTGSPWEAVKSALVSDYSTLVLNVSKASKHAKVNAALSAMSFCNLLLPLALLGWVRLRRRLGGSCAAALWALAAVHIVFFVRYPVPDQFTFILPSMTMIAVASAVGLAEVASWGSRRGAIVVVVFGLAAAGQPVLFAAAPSLARSFVGDLAKQRKPFRDEARYWLVPWKHDERSAQRFAQKTLSEAEAGTVLEPDSTAVYPLLLVRELQGLGKDVIISPPPGCR